MHHSSAASAPTAHALVSELTHLGVRAAAFAADLSTYAAAKALHAAVVAALGPPDVFFGNHGAAFATIGPRGDVGDVSPEMFEQTWRLNTGTNFNVSG